MRAAIPELTEAAVIDSAGAAIAAELKALFTKPLVAAQWSKPAGDWVADWTAKLKALINGITAAHAGK